MRIFVCDDTYEGKMTAIYEAWDWVAKKHDRSEIGFMIKPVSQMNMFCEYIYVDADDEKARSVTEAIQSKISFSAYIDVYYAAMSESSEAISDIYEFLRLGFSYGSKVTMMMGDSRVQKIFEYRKRVGNEIHHFREFVRFSKYAMAFNGAITDMYISHIEPKCNVVYMVGGHFADRMPMENWMIIDDKRKIATIHPALIDDRKSKDEIEEVGFYKNTYIRNLTDEEFDFIKGMECQQDGYVDLWKTFFDAIAIKQRTNYRCQRNLIPIWMRKNVTEFN